MLNSYFKIAVRNLWNKKLYSGINLLGLSIAVAFSMLVYMYMQQERSFDTFHKNSKRLFRLEASSLFDSDKDKKTKKGFFSFLIPADNSVRNMLTHPYVLADDIKNAFPEVEAVVRRQGAGGGVVWYNNEAFKMDEDKATYIENNFFTVFDFHLLKGNPSLVLKSASGVVINERTAKRFFGTNDPIGKTIRITTAGDKLFTVTGVAKDFPVNSSMDFDLLMPLEAHPSHLENSADRSNNHFNYQTLLLLRENTDVAIFKTKLTAFSKKYFAATVNEWQKEDPEKKAIDFQLYLRSLTAAHYNAAFPWGHYTNMEGLLQLAALALIILLIACVNYVLLTLTNTVSRSQEVGIRKTMGAGRKQIVWQFIIETQLLVLLSVLAGLFICIATVPLFNKVSGANISAGIFSARDFAWGAVMLFFILGITAGLYPALVMSGMKPLNMMRKFSSVKINPFLAKALVVVQYAACIALIISSIAVSRQMQFMNAMQLGFDKEQVLLIENPYDYEDPKRIQFAQRMYQYAATEPSIAKATCSNTKFGYGFNINGHLINNKREMIFQIPVDFNYFNFMNIELAKGRFFSKEMPTDSVRIDIPDKLKMEGSSSVRKAIVVNEVLYNLLGKPALDEINSSMGARIIGVCKDYQFFSATQKVAPAYHLIGGKFGFQFACLKIKPGHNIPALIDRVKSNWNKITASQPFSFSFMDEEVKKGYESYTQWLKTIRAATILAVIIACMGLFGLSALYAVNRTKEVGIRKVMGASVTDIFMLLNKDILKLALVSFIIAVPISVYFTNGWLQNFANRIHLGWFFIVLAGTIGLLLAIGTVSYHAIRAARANPVQSLRTE